MRTYKPKKREISKHGKIISTEIKKGMLTITVEIPKFKYVKHKLDCGCDVSIFELEEKIYNLIQTELGIFPDGTTVDVEVK